MTRTARLMWVTAILFICITFDQVVKAAAQNVLAASGPISIWKDLIRLEYIENPGAILGMGAALPGVLRLSLIIVFVMITVVMTIFFVFKPPHGLQMVQLVGFAMVTAGGIGNLIDRIINQGRVVDYVSFGIGPLRTGIMNLADMAIFFGALIFILFHKRQPSPESPESK